MNDVVGTCPNLATEQFVYYSFGSECFRISPPVCNDCSEDAQPPETVHIMTLIEEELPCSGPFSDFYFD